MTTRRWLALGAVGALVLAGCGKGTSSTSPNGGAKKAGRVVEVRMVAGPRFQPDSIAVKAGETVTFKVTNDDKALHDFMIGDEAGQAQREKDMAAMSSAPMEMDPSADSVSVKAGATANLSWTFSQAGTLLYGSHQPGDYAAGMKGTITVS